MRSAAIPEMALREYTLANGLRVYLSENHEEPWISCRIAVRAGAGQEPEHATGLAHYLEHMLANKGSRFLGTRDPEAELPHLERLRGLYDELRDAELGAGPRGRREVLGEIDRENQALNRYAIANELKQTYGLLGARGLNAYTSHDRTVYVVDVPANGLEAWARLEGDRFANPVFRGFATEIETIIEEKNRAFDNSSRVLALAAAARVHAGHPYGRDVLGEIEHLLCPSIRGTEAFFATWYVPNNMAIVLAGDFEAERALELIEANFGGLEPRELPEYATPHPEGPADGGPPIEVVHRGDEEVRLIWRTVPREHEDAEALMLADMMLDNNSTGLLDTRLQQTQKVRAAGAFPSLRVQAGTQTVWGRPRIGQSLDEVEALLREQVAALQAGEFAQSDLDDLIANFEVAELRRLESNGARAALMLDAFVHRQEWDRVRTRLARLATIERDRVVETARRWLAAEPVVARRREGEPQVTKIPVFGLTELALDSRSHSRLFTEVMAMPRAEPRLQVLSCGEDFEREELESALVYTTQNPNNDLFQLTLRWHTGSAHDPLLAKGLALWPQAGVGALDLEGYRRALFRDAAAVAIDCRRQRTDLTLAGRGEVLERVFGLIRRRLREPRLSREDLRRWAEDVVGKRIQRRETANFKFAALKQWALRGPESPYLCEALSNEEVLALELDELRAKPGSLLGLERVVVYAGPHGRGELRELLELDAPAAPVPAYLRPKFDVDLDGGEGTRILVLHHEAAQTKIGLYVPSEPYDPDRSATYRVFHEYLGGGAGLVFQEIRESRGLAYAAHAGHTAGVRLGDPNLIWASIASRPDRCVAAIGVLLDLIRGMPLDRQRFERARSSAIEKLIGGRVRFRGYGFTAETWRLRGLDADPRPRVLEQLRSFEAEELERFAAPLATAGIAVVVVGDTRGLDLEGLAALGRVERCELDDLVVY